MGGMPGGKEGEEVAELKQAFEEMSARIQAQVARIEQIEGQRRELIANVSHDLRTPLASLQGYLETLALTEVLPTGVEHIRWIEVAPQPDRSLMPVSQRVIDIWRENGAVIDGTVIVCDQFWATQEIAPCRGIVEETMKHFLN